MDPDPAARLATQVQACYDDLRAIARRVVTAEPQGTPIHPTSLVHKAFLRLAGQFEVSADGSGCCVARAVAGFVAPKLAQKPPGSGVPFPAPPYSWRNGTTHRGCRNSFSRLGLCPRPPGFRGMAPVPNEGIGGPEDHAPGRGRPTSERAYSGSWRCGYILGTPCHGTCNGNSRTVPSGALRNTGLLKRCFAQEYRRILVDEARARSAQKRGGGHRVGTLIESAVALGQPGAIDVLQLNDAIQALTQLNRRMGEIAEMRLFAGMTIAECAEALRLAIRTVEKDWTFARSWLRRELA